MKYLELTNGKKVKVDNNVFSYFSQFVWGENKGYAQATSLVNPKNPSERRLHRLLLNVKRGQFVDHKNGDTLDCRFSNLRIVSHQQNMWNHKAHKNSKTGVPNVIQLKNGKYRAQIRYFGKLRYFGHYTLLDQAKKAVENAKKILRGKYRRKI
jgi:hypothetical protein